MALLPAPLRRRLAPIVWNIGAGEEREALDRCWFWPWQHVAGWGGVLTRPLSSVADAFVGLVGEAPMPNGLFLQRLPLMLVRSQEALIKVLCVFLCLFLFFP